MTAGDRQPYAVGTTLPGSSYLLGKVLGIGGTAAVYQAEDTTCGRQVVVKVVRPDVARRGTFTAAEMQREARMLVALQAETDHVVEVITAGITDDPNRLPYYVMEQLVGQTLRVTFDRRQATHVPISVDEVVSMSVDLGIALDHAHRRGITHLDVKPDNAFVHQKKGGQLVMKLLDFGISTMLSSTLGVFRGTYRYAAPEQIRGARVSATTDLYALGLVMYEALAGRRPFEAAGERLPAEAIARAHCEQAPAELLPLRPDAPGPLVGLIMQCLEKRPEDRPPSAAYLVGSLREMRRRSAPSTLSARSYLEALTAVIEPNLSVTRVSPVVTAATVDGAPPASEVFMTAAVPVVPTMTMDRSQPAPETYAAAVLSNAAQSTAPPALPRVSRAPVAIGVACALGVMLGVVLFVSRGEPLHAESAPAPAPSAVATPPPGTASPPAAASEIPATPSTVAPSPAPATTSTRPAPTSSTPAPSAASHAAHATPTVRPETPRPNPRTTSQTPPPSSSAPPGITTQKDWF
jgi:serine/threonine protein kinase